jgi:phosphoribosyl-AMP cyclohydrolase
MANLYHTCLTRRRANPDGNAGRPPYDDRVPTATPIDASAEQLATVTYNGDGLVPAIVQEHGTGEILMLAWMNEATLKETLESGRTVFWSRSRQERWAKGDTSGDRQWVREAFYDCDGDTLLFVVEQEGAGACHTGERTCFFRSFGSADAAPQ